MIMKLPSIFCRLYQWAVKQFFSPQFIKYFIVGISAVILDMATLYLLKSVVGLTAVWSIVINQILMSSYVFLLNKYWVFGSTGAFARQAIRYFSLAVVNYLIAIAWMWCFNEILGFNYLLVRLANIALSTVWNFLIYRFFVYAKGQDN